MPGYPYTKKKGTTTVEISPDKGGNWLLERALVVKNPKHADFYLNRGFRIRKGRLLRPKERTPVKLK